MGSYCIEEASLVLVQRKSDRVLRQPQQRLWQDPVACGCFVRQFAMDEVRRLRRISEIFIPFPPQGPHSHFTSTTHIRITYPTLTVSFAPSSLRPAATAPEPRPPETPKTPHFQTKLAPEQKKKEKRLRNK